MINIQVLGMSNKGIYLCRIESEGYFIFSLESGSIDLGDVLSHSHWTDREGLILNVINVNHDVPVRICLENWSMSLNAAKDALKRIGKPSKVFFL